MLEGSRKYFDNNAISDTIDRIEREFGREIWEMSPAEIADNQLGGNL